VSIFARSSRFFALVGLSAVVFGCGGGGTSSVPPALSAPDYLVENHTVQKTVNTPVTYQLNIAHTGAASDQRMKLPLSIVWKRTFGPTSVTYPIAAQGVVYVGSGSSLYALDATTGNTLWQQAASEAGLDWVGAAYDNGVIFAQETGNELFALDAKTGKQLWQATLPDQNVFSSPPTAANGVVYTAGSGTGGDVYALSETTGHLLWEQNVLNGENSSPAVTRDAVYVSYECLNTYAFNVSSGSIIWKFPGNCDASNGWTPVLFDSNVYVEGNTYPQLPEPTTPPFMTPPPSLGVILGAANGGIRGVVNTNFPPAFADHVGYALEINATYTQNDLVAFNAKTGGQLWAAPPPSGDNFEMPAIVVDGVVYDVTNLGTFLAFDSHSGRQLESLSLGAPAIGVPSYPHSISLGLAVSPGRMIAPDGSSVVALGAAAVPTPSPRPSRSPR